MKLKCGAMILAAVLLMSVAGVPGARGQLSERAPGLSEQTAKVVAPVKMFDNMYYVGLDFVCAYVIKTSQGLILVDTLYVPFENHTIDAIKELGMDPKDIKYVIISHGHDDHYAGALAVKAAAPQARFMMTEVDYDLMEKTFKGGKGSAKGIISRDLVAKEGDTLTLGDTTLKLHITPGHTPGVISFEMPVYDNGKKYNLFYWAGPTLQSNQLPVMEQFQATTKRLQAEFPNVDVMIHSHPWSVSLIDKVEKARTRKPGDPNPFVNPKEFQEFMASRIVDTDKRIAAVKAKQAAGQ
ncbi:MAG: MBL fold metallo-hydrolase [Bryobacteraceae bacterium]|jgi:metallo-beta-lactamase class B